MQADTQRRDARDAQERIDVQAGSSAATPATPRTKPRRRKTASAGTLRTWSTRGATDERREALEQNEGLQAQLRQIQRMNSLGQLAGGVAHDFNNLLAVILSYATFVSRRLAMAAESGGDGDWDEARADMEHIQQAVERAAALTRQLLAFASREAIRPLALNLNEVIAHVEELLRRAIGEHITLTTSLADGLWPILADAGKLEQVLVNLAVNARDAMPGGGTLTIATENITTAADSAGAGPWAAPRTSCPAAGQRHWHGHDSRRHRTRIRPFLHHQGRQQGNRARPRDRLRDTHPGWGQHPGLLPARERDHLHDRAARHRRGRRTRPGNPRPSSWEPHGETILVVEDDRRAARGNQADLR